MQRHLPRIPTPPVLPVAEKAKEIKLLNILFLIDCGHGDCAVFGENSATGRIDASFDKAHRAHTGDLPPVFNTACERNQIRNIADATWGNEIVSQPIKVSANIGVDTVEGIRKVENK